MKVYGRLFALIGILCVGATSQGNAEHPGYAAEKNQVFSFQLQQLQAYEDFIFLPDVFTSEECQKIIKLGLSLKLNEAVLGGNDISQEENIKNIKTRKSKLSWISWNEDTDWIFQKLYEYAAKVNNIHYQFDLSGFYEKIQFTEYESPDGHYTWHTDGGNKEFSNRKLSMVVQLSNPQDYEGGELQIFTDRVSSIEKKQGAVAFFPSYTPHRVTPITKGKRYTLVVWVSGPPFK